MSTETISYNGTGISERWGTTISSPSLYSSPESTFGTDNMVTEYSLSEIFSLPEHAVSEFSPDTSTPIEQPIEEPFTPLKLSFPETNIFIDGSESAAPVSLGTFGTIYRNDSTSKPSHEVTANESSQTVETEVTPPIEKTLDMTPEQSELVTNLSEVPLEQLPIQKKLPAETTTEMPMDTIVEESSHQEIAKAVATYEALIDTIFTPEEAKELIIAAVEEKPEEVQSEVQIQLGAITANNTDVDTFAKTGEELMIDEMIENLPILEEDEKKRLEHLLLANKNEKDDIEELYWVDEEANKARIELILGNGKELGKKLQKGKKIIGKDLVNTLPRKQLVPPELLSELVRVDYFSKGRDGSYNRIIDDLKKDSEISTDPEKLENYATRLTKDHTAVRSRQLFEENPAAEEEVDKVLDTEDWNIFK